MQPKSIELLPDKSNLSTSNQPITSHHGNFQQNFRTTDTATHEKVPECPNSSKIIHRKSYTEEAILQDQSQVWPFIEKDSQSSYTREKFQDEGLLITSFEEFDQDPELRINLKNVNKNYALIDGIPNEILTQILSYLPAESLAVASSVSKRFNKLVTTPHVWRIAFSRIFPEQNLYGTSQKKSQDSGYKIQEEFSPETRLFTRLTEVASWRSEYILRTGLLGCLKRGKPVKNSINGESLKLRNNIGNANPVVTYSSRLSTTVNHIHAHFHPEQRTPQFIHGTDETCSATISDPSSGKVAKWALSELHESIQLMVDWTDHILYGLDDGPTVVPNSMDVSHLFGVIVGEGHPGGKTYYQSTNEMRGRYLNIADDTANHDVTIPKVPERVDGVSAVWIAKSNSIPNMTAGLVGVLCGSTLGIVTAYSTGFDSDHLIRIPKGTITARWALSPGVPIIAFDVDDSFNSTRKARRRIWAVALNALGEVFYLKQAPNFLNTKLKENLSDLRAWTTGRTVNWHMIEASRRVSRDDPYQELKFSASYSPRSSSNNQNLSHEELETEAREIERFFQYTPAHFRKVCHGWDMRRKLHVDFAGDDGNGAGEALFVIKCGISGGQHAEVLRMTRQNSEMPILQNLNSEMLKRPVTSSLTDNKICFDFSPASSSGKSRSSTADLKSIRICVPEKSPQYESIPTIQSYSKSEKILKDNWGSTYFSLKNYLKSEITTSAIDMSTFALPTVEEDLISIPSRGIGSSNSNLTFKSITSGQTKVPGHRARLLVVGTKTGSLIIWNMRSPQSTNLSIANEVFPLRTIDTDSPQISCIAVSALYIVHGGTDGLVQAWDPLASTSQPLRTLHSRFSSPARRRLANNDIPAPRTITSLSAAGMILLDPDPTKLRGIVSLGTNLRYWAYSSSATDEYPKKRRRRLIQRGNNFSGECFRSSGRGSIRDQIQLEHADFMNENLIRTRETAHLKDRFGVGIYGLTEEEALTYAEIVSTETYTRERENLTVAYCHSASELVSSSNDKFTLPESQVENDAAMDYFERDLREAIRLSLL